MFEILFKKMAGTSESSPRKRKACPAVMLSSNSQKRSRVHLTRMSQLVQNHIIHQVRRYQHQVTGQLMVLAEVQLPHRERAAVIRTFR